MKEHEGGGEGGTGVNPGSAVPSLEGGGNTCETSEHRGDLR